MDAIIYELKNWWLDKRKERWIVNGNCYGNPKFHEGDMIHTAPVEKFKLSAEAFLIETKNTVYLCRYENSMEENFQWSDSEYLWQEVLSEEDKESYQGRMLFSRLRRLHVAEQELKSEIQDDEYILMTLSDQKNFYFEDFLYHSVDKEMHLKKYVNLGFRMDSVLLSTDLFDLKEGFPEIDIRYYPRGENLVQFYMWDSGSINVYIINSGTKEIVVDTYCGRFIIKPNGKKYRIAPDAIAGRCAKYTRNDDWCGK